MNQHELFSLKGQNAIVTGGSGYLGSAISEGLAKYGANVMIVSRSKEKCMNLAEQLNQKYNVKCQGYALDVSDSNSINHTFEEIYNSDMKIDILINNAYFGAGKTIEEMTEWEWETGIDGSINNVFRVTKRHYNICYRRIKEILLISLQCMVLFPQTLLFMAIQALIILRIMEQEKLLSYSLLGILRVTMV